MLRPHTAPQSPLEELIECVHYRVLLCLDEGALCAFGKCCRTLAVVAREQALWQRLAMCRNRLAPAQFLGALSREAGEVVSSEDPRPATPHGGAGLCAGARVTGRVDWRDVCRQLNCRMAERPWEPDLCEDGRSLSLWTELTDDLLEEGEEDRAEPEAAGAARVPTSRIFASQSPHLLWIGGNRLLAVAGGYSPDVVGGVALSPLHEVYLLDLPDMAGGATSGPTSPDLGATRLDCGTAGGRLPRGHPSMNGSACDFDPIRKTVYFFGGGSPHSDVNNATSALRLHGWEGAGAAGEGARADVPTARWEVVDSPGSVEAGQMPSARQGLRGTVFSDEFIIFGGRMLGGVCANDVWSLDLTGDGGSSSPSSSSRGSITSAWRPLVCEGTAPSPRVWYGACQAVHGRWFIYGGSTWQFEEPAEPHDFRQLFVLDLAGRRWSSVDPCSGLRPPWAVATALVPLGSCQLLLLGGTLPHRLGSDGLNARSLQRWRTWYNRLDMPFVFDLGAKSWSERRAAVAAQGYAQQEDYEQHVAEVYLRSHFAACFVPHRRSVVVFGGSRYFTGEYFNDVLELQLPASRGAGPRFSRSGRPPPALGEGRRAESGHPVCGVFRAADALPRHLRQEPRERTILTRGLLGRLRGMLRDGIISREQFNLIRAPA